jgi:haloalkane dehalogenase
MPGWRDAGKLFRQTPDVALLVVLSTGLASPVVVFPALTDGTDPGFEGQAARVYRGFSAPYRSLADAAYNGLRRFPLSIPLGHRDDASDNGNAAAQTHHYKTLLRWNKPVHFIWGCADDIFDEAWGRKWAAQMNASFDAIADASHFLQSSHGAEVAELILHRVGDE